VTGHPAADGRPSAPPCLGRRPVRLRARGQSSRICGRRRQWSSTEGEPPIVILLAVDLRLPVEALTWLQEERRKVQRKRHRQRNAVLRTRGTTNFKIGTQTDRLLTRRSELGHRLAVLVEERQIKLDWLIRLRPRHLKDQGYRRRRRIRPRDRPTATVDVQLPFGHRGVVAQDHGELHATIMAPFRPSADQHATEGRIVIAGAGCTTTELGAAFVPELWPIPVGMRQVSPDGAVTTSARYAVSAPSIDSRRSTSSVPAWKATPERTRCQTSRKDDPTAVNPGRSSESAHQASPSWWYTMSTLISHLPSSLSASSTGRPTSLTRILRTTRGGTVTPSWNEKSSRGYRSDSIVRWEPDCRTV
jgi:hypothetical protein